VPVIDAKEGSQLDLDIAALLDAPADRQEQLLRRILVERLDFETASGSVPILRQRVAGIPDAATRIASLDGMQALFVTLPTGKITTTIAKAIIKQLTDQVGDHLLVARTDDGSVVHFIYPRFVGSSRIVLRRIVLERGRPRRTAVERLGVLYLERVRDGLDARTAIERAFDVEAVTKRFYEQYKDLFRDIQRELFGQTSDEAWAHDYALQLLNRVMFLYFIDRKGWLESNFLRRFWRAYRQSGRPVDTFFEEWLKVLFFEAFNNKFSHPSSMPQEIRNTLQMAPYLNGGLFERNRLDEAHNPKVSDELWRKIMEFFDGYNFTIAESTPWDQEVAVDPEMIGKVYESLVNVSEIDERGQAGIFYTPRTEIDLMCRLSLVDYLANHLGEGRKPMLYNVVFAVEQDEKDEADRVLRDENLWPEFDRLTREVSVVDPACGSGSFLVGMLQVLNDLSVRANRELGRQESPYERKKRIIGQSLYGVDVMQWAVNVAELRLWLQLIIDTEIPEPERKLRPLLPNLSFKVRCGDSLVQEVGGVNMSHLHGRSELPAAVKGQITRLKGEKLRFFNNERGHLEEDALQREELGVFRAALDKQIDGISQQLRQKKASLDAARVQQGQLAGIARERGRQASLEETRLGEEIERLEAQLEEAKSARLALITAKDVPFVWDIAFVEVFSGDSEGFDIVIGNPPYVRQEKIADPREPRDLVTVESRKVYKGKLAGAVYAGYPRSFGFNASADPVKHKINAQSDLYIYFYFLSLALLNEKGSFCFITSNSWLDVGYGADLQEFLLRHSHVKIVLDNQLKRSFTQAGINTVIALLAPPTEDGSPGLEKTARFVMFKVPFEQVLSPVIFREIEEATERRTAPEYRVSPIGQMELLKEGSDVPEESREETGWEGRGPLIKVVKYIGNKWGGKYLRAPDIYWTILEKGKGKLVRLGDIAEIRRGFTTGINDFFYLDRATIKQWDIEKEFLKPVLKTPREVTTIYVPPNSLKTWVFSCCTPKSDLSGMGALKYIEWGESQVSKGRQKQAAGIPWPDLRTVTGRSLWYSLEMKKPGDFFCNRFFNDRFFFCYSNGVVEDQTFYAGTFKKRDLPIEASMAVINCSIGYLTASLLGRVALGEGVLQYAVYEMADLLVIDPWSVASSARQPMLDAFHELKMRPIEAVESEMRQSDRRALDEIIFDDLGLTQDERGAVYEAVIELVRDRLNKAESARET